MIKGLGGMLGGIVGDKLKDLAGDAAGPVIEQVLEVVQGLLDGGEMSGEQEGALGQLAEMLGVGSPEEIVEMGAEKIADSGIGEKLPEVMGLLEKLKG
ncbi:MAG: hypothetical protein AAGP08_15095 [Pseudomonadota bacterium]